jgi:hypothetical protein
MGHGENSVDLVNAFMKRFREDDLAYLVLYLYLKRRRFREFCSLIIGKRGGARRSPRPVAKKSKPTFSLLSKFSDPILPPPPTLPCAEIG